MKIFLALFNIENNAHSVEKSAYKNKPQGQRINLFYHRLDSDYNYPAHCDIAYNRRLAELFKVNRVQHNAKNSRTPNDSEKNPAKRTSQRHKGDRGVSSCDEEENGVVIHYPEKLFGFWIGDSVIKGRHGVKYDKRSSENSGAYNAPSVGVNGSENDKNGSAGNG